MEVLQRKRFLKVPYFVRSHPSAATTQALLHRRFPISLFCEASLHIVTCGCYARSKWKDHPVERWSP